MALHVAYYQLDLGVESQGLIKLYLKSLLLLIRLTFLRGFGVGTQVASVQMALHVSYYQLDLGVESQVL